MKIGIVGAGAIGLTFEAAHAGVHDVVVLARRGASAEAIARAGVTIECGYEVGNARVRATTDARALADREAVIVAVKAYSTVEALAPLRGVLPSGTLGASVQNGI